MPSSPDGERMSRRHFHRRAITAAAALGVTALAGADAPAQEPAPAQTPDDAALDRAMADALAAAPHLPAEDREELRKQVKGSLDLAKALRDIRVEEGAEPAFVFSPALPKKGAARG